MVKEILIPLPNEPGRLSAVSDLLLVNGIKIIAFQVSKEGETGRLRLVVNDPERALNVLRTEEYQTREKQVLACEVPDHPGGLNAVLKPLKTNGINIDAIYPVLGADSALIISLDQAETGLKLLRDHWIRILGEDVYKL